ncbi:MAG: GSCFA domain-containing protein, partial [Bacteroidetes bacterium]|nr:GSCFA domain-containing protein [Candidatus Cryptobacteroides excrementavium]
HIASGQVVSNCLKRDAREFERERMEPEDTVRVLSGIIGGGNDRSFILTVSPIRHFKDGAHGNQVSKASLLIAADRLCSIFHDRCEYFPSYEIMMDELRDYRFYAEDMLHPSDQAVRYIWERFCDFALPEEDRGRLAAEEKRLRQSLHRPIPRE